MGHRSESFKDYLLEKIKNPVERAAYINAALEDGNPKLLLAVLKDCVEAMGGIAWLAQEAHMTRAAIYRILSESGNPKYQNLVRLLAPMGLRINVAAVVVRNKRVNLKIKQQGHRHRQGYQAHPATREEAGVWEKEQAWGGE
jgi:probable addiction module antidote protein